MREVLPQVVPLVVASPQVSCDLCQSIAFISTFALWGSVPRGTIS